jgi:hypothetical protein
VRSSSGHFPTDYRIRIKKPLKQKKIHSRAWNDRFNVTYSKDNEKYHTYFKEFFDKPIKQKPEQITFFPRPQDPEIIKKFK